MGFVQISFVSGWVYVCMCVQAGVCKPVSVRLLAFVCIL